MSRENQAVCADMARLCSEKETAEHRLSDALRQAAEATQAARAAQVSDALNLILSTRYQY
jgi:hypothetical protein